MRNLFIYGRLADNEPMEYSYDYKASGYKLMCVQEFPSTKARNAYIKAIEEIHNKKLRRLY